MKMIVKSAIVLFVLSQQLCAVQFVFNNRLSLSTQIRGDLFFTTGSSMATPVLSKLGTSTLVTSDRSPVSIEVVCHLSDGRQLAFYLNAQQLLIPATDKAKVTLAAQTLDLSSNKLNCLYINENGQSKSVTLSKV